MTDQPNFEMTCVDIGFDIRLSYRNHLITFSVVVNYSAVVGRFKVCRFLHFSFWGSEQLREMCQFQLPHRFQINCALFSIYYWTKQHEQGVSIGVGILLVTVWESIYRESINIQMRALLSHTSNTDFRFHQS